MDPFAFDRSYFSASELAKIAIMMFTARILSEAQTDTHCDDSVLQKFLLFVGPVILLIFMDNFSTSALIGAVCFILFMIARMRWRLLAMTLGTALRRLLWCCSWEFIYLRCKNGDGSVRWLTVLQILPKAERMETVIPISRYRLVLRWLRGVEGERDPVTVRSVIFCLTLIPILFMLL